MKILFTSEAVVEVCNGKYYKTSFNPFIDRYKFFGSVIFASYKKEVESSKQSVLNTTDVQFEFFKKENTLYSAIYNSLDNKKHMKKCVESADIVVAHLPSTIGMMALRYARRLHKPYFIGVVGCAWDAYWNYSWKGKMIALPRYIEMRREILRAKYVFYVTQRFLQHRYPCHGLTMGCSNVEIDRPSETILNRRLNIIQNRESDKPINIVTVAAVNVRYKGQEYVIRAIAELNLRKGHNFHYYLIGGGDNSFLLNIVKELHVENYVHFVGPVPHEQIMERLDLMDVYIQPSKQEGLPRALIEAMSRALPAFGSTTAGIPELLPNECLFHNGAVGEIVGKLSSLTSEKMMTLARINYYKSFEYTRDVLSKRRLEFFDAIMTEISYAKDLNR